MLPVQLAKPLKTLRKALTEVSARPDDHSALTLLYGLKAITDSIQIVVEVSCKVEYIRNTVSWSAVIP